MTATGSGQGLSRRLQAAKAGAAAAAVWAILETRRRLGGSTMRNAIGFALLEHVTLYPLSTLVDRYHPARGDPSLPPLARSSRAFAQATLRHLVFGAALGALLSRRSAR